MRHHLLHSLASRLGLIVLASLVPAVLVALTFSSDAREHMETEARLRAAHATEGKPPSALLRDVFPASAGNNAKYIPDPMPLATQPDSEPRAREGIPVTAALAQATASAKQGLAGLFLAALASLIGAFLMAKTNRVPAEGSLVATPRLAGGELCCRSHSTITGTGKSELAMLAAATVSPANATTNTTANTLAGTAARPLTVLLAEDTPANVTIAQAYLKRLGHQCDHAADGRQALEMLAAKTYDLVLMDLEMPRMDGMETTGRLRAGEAGEVNRTIPVLAMTAHALDSIREKCLRAGMTGFITKPVSFQHLAEALAPLAPRPETTAQGSSAPPSVPQGQAAPSAEGGSGQHKAAPALLNLASALDMLDGDSALLAIVLDTYAEDMPRKRAALRTGLERIKAGEQEAWAALHLTAHSLRSASASIGAQPASKAAEALEQAAAEGAEALRLELLVLGLDRLLGKTLEQVAAERPSLDG